MQRNRTDQRIRTARFASRFADSAQRDARHTLRGRVLRCEPLEDRQLLDAALGQEALEVFGTSQALFAENQGQWPYQSVRYAFNSAGANVLLTDSGPVFQLFQQDDVDQVDEMDEMDWMDGVDAFGEPDVAGQFDPATEPVIRQTQFAVRFDGGQEVEPVGLDQAATVYNYFVGDQANWRAAGTHIRESLGPAVLRRTPRRRACRHGT